MWRLKSAGFFLFFFLISRIGLLGQTADGVVTATAVAVMSDGVNSHYYATLHEAMAAAAGAFNQPDEITLLADLVLDEPLTVGDGVHIRLVAGGADRTIRRGSKNIEFPVIWVNGENASLSLGKPAMELKLIVDGGYTEAAGAIQAHAPLAAVSGQGAKLIMYDGVTLQNNYNNGAGPSTSHYRNGAGVSVRTELYRGDRQAEFIMKGGTIRGNVNDSQHPAAFGGGVLVRDFGVFTMEGGTIMDNTATHAGGGVLLANNCSFKKTGGIIYGSDAPAGLRNTALEGNDLPFKRQYTYGHAIYALSDDALQVLFRDDTVGENESLSYTGMAKGLGIVGTGEKWDNWAKIYRRRFVVIVLLALVFAVSVFLIAMRIVVKRRLAKITPIADGTQEISLENLNLTDREKEICTLLLTKLTFKEIAAALKLSHSGVSFHSQSLYRRLGIKSRKELFVKLGIRNDKSGSENERG